MSSESNFTNSKEKCLRELATQFFLDFTSQNIDFNNIFDQWIASKQKKQEVNFEFALPLVLRQRVLREIGIITDSENDSNSTSDTNQQLYLSKEDNKNEKIEGKVLDNLNQLKFEPVQNSTSKYFRYLNLLEKIINLPTEQLIKISEEELSKIIKEYGKELGIESSDLDTISLMFPKWLNKLTQKFSVEISPINVYEVSEIESKISAQKPDQSIELQFSGIIGSSEKMQSIFSCIKKISASNLTVLIQGESGTGKELIAHAIHDNSPRAKYPFIAVNCGALPDSIIESELFGHEKGAFTGALFQKIGYFELANKGTIFLDEISETSLNFQVKLLRVLQDHKIVRVGSVKPLDIDVRVIAATNRDLLTMVKEGKFRHDLYYRINEMTIILPPLRERISDLPFLISYFLEKFSKENNKPTPKISKQAQKLLLRYHWPGNIRELENVIKRAIVLCDDEILPIHLPPQLLEFCSHNSLVTSEDDSLHAQIEKAERSIIIKALANHNYNITLTARALKISRRTLQRKIKEHNIVIQKK